jgi:hypothetical protein
MSLLVIINGSACAFWRDPPPPPVFEKVAVVAEVAKDDDGTLKGDLHADTAYKGALIGGGAGVVAGATGGAALGAATAPACGPLAPICLPINMIALGGVGAIGGLFVGAGAGAVTGLGRGTAGEVNRVLERIEGSRDLTAELQTAMNAAVPAEKQVAPEQAQAVVTARIDEFDLRQHMSSRLSLRVSGSMTQEWDGGDPEPEKKTCKYDFWSPEQDVEDWLLDDGQPFDEAFTRSIDTLATWMARDLEAFSTRQAQPETDEFPETCYQP